MEGPKVSVIIPAYNREHTIGRAMRSVLHQTFQDFEIIVVDDGSTDGTAKVIKRFRDPRIRHLHHEKNRGAAAARNTGIKAACGEYIAFLDSDDEWLPEKLDEQIGALQNAPDGVYASCTGLFLHLIDTNLVIKKIPCQPASWFKHLLLGCDLSPGATLVVHKSSFDKVGLLDDTLLRFEDWDWLLRYLKEYQLILVQKPLVKVHRSGHPRAVSIEQSTVRFTAKHYRDLQAFGSYYRRKVMARHWLKVARAFYREGKLRKGSTYFLKAFFENPIQQPGTYLMLVDAIFGTSMALRASRLKQWVLKH